MRKVILPLFILTVCTAQIAWADDMTTTQDSVKTTPSQGSYQGSYQGSDNSKINQPGTAADDTAGVSTANTGELKAGGLRDEVVGIKPQIGAINFKDANGDVGNRALVGFTAEMNAASLVANALGMGASAAKNVYLGPQIGFIYSHIGGPDSQFFGGNPQPTNVSTDSSNMFYVPTDLKLGYNLGNFRVALHGGANFFYRSVASSIQLGFNPDNGTGSAVSYLPNAGADLEYGVTNAIAVILRPDMTFGGSNRVWAATLGLSLPIG